MKKLLVVVDMQNDFIDGSLGTDEAQKIVQNVVAKIKNFDGDVICTRDTHPENYLDTNEGKHLPIVHCIDGTHGHAINGEVFGAFMEKGDGRFIELIDKYTFGSTALPEIIRHKWYEYIELVGLCTDICVVSNALLLKANYPEICIAVDPKCCAGATPDSHEAALKIMQMCQIEMVGE